MSPTKIPNPFWFSIDAITSLDVAWNVKKK
jgi:hypothetical protein